jgi:sulfur-carrier protein
VTALRVRLPQHLQTLANVSGEVELDVDDVGDPPTLGGVLDALETRHPMLRGTMRDHATRTRRPFVRFFAGEDDVSHAPADALLPADVVDGRVPLSVVGAMAGG